jgi:chromosome partitioning protein
MTVIVYGNEKGGPGKSTLSICHVWYARKEGKRVCFIDFDEQGNGTSIFRDACAGFSSAQLFDPNLELDDELAELDLLCVPAVRKALAVVSSDTETVAKALDREHRDVAAIQRVYDTVLPVIQNIEVLEELFDVVVIDTAPHRDVKMIAAMMAADYMVSPIELDEFSFQGIYAVTQSIVPFVTEARRQIGRNFRFLGMAINKLNVASAGQKQAMDFLLSTPALQSMTIPRPIRQSVAFGDAMRARQSIFEIKTESAKRASAGLEEFYGYINGIIEGA